jgi:methylated-DNA-[protein]-cysteine S-methyltransferase
MNRRWRPRATRIVETPLGPMLAALRPALGHREVPLAEEPQSRQPVASEGGDDPLFDALAGELHEYFRGRRREFGVPLDLSRGTPFQQAVWRALLAVPCGATTSYGRIAREIGKPAAARAVGAAVGRNPVGIIVPCHRVFGADDAPTGYAGGIERKIALRRLEAAGAPAVSAS